MCPSTEDTALEDYILAFALAPGSKKKATPIRGKTVLQKLLFHLRKSLESIPGHGIRHFYGPFDEQAQVVLEQLETSGYMRTAPDSSLISLTPKGEGEAREVWDNLDSDVRDLVESLKAYLGDLNTDEVLAITYAEYPEEASQSIVRKEIAAKGPSLALKLVKRGKVSPELGSKIAGMDLREFLRYLSRNKVPVVEHGPSLSQH